MNKDRVYMLAVAAFVVIGACAAAAGKPHLAIVPFYLFIIVFIPHSLVVHAWMFVIGWSNLLGHSDTIEFVVVPAIAMVLGFGTIKVVWGSRFYRSGLTWAGCGGAVNESVPVSDAATERAASTEPDNEVRSS